MSCLCCWLSTPESPALQPKPDLKRVKNWIKRGRSCSSIRNRRHSSLPWALCLCLRFAYTRSIAGDLFSCRNRRLIVTHYEIYFVQQMQKVWFVFVPITGTVAEQSSPILAFIFYWVNHASGRQFAAQREKLGGFRGIINNNYLGFLIKKIIMEFNYKHITY